MIKLYRTRFTPLELRTLSEHCQNFCPYGIDKSECLTKPVLSIPCAQTCNDLRDTQKPLPMKFPVPKPQIENLHIVKFFTLGYKFPRTQFPY